MGLSSRALHSTRGSSSETAGSHSRSRQMNGCLRNSLNLPPPPANKGDGTPELPTTTSPVPSMTPAFSRLASSATHKGVGSCRGSVRAGGTAQQRPDAAAPWENSQLELHELADLYEEIEHCMSHCRYAISVIGALIDAGFSGRTANKVTLVCPEECKDVIRGWAMTVSGVGTGGAAGADSVTLRTRDGSLRLVRIRWLAGNDFGRLEIVPSSISKARVLGLANQLDQIATAWVRARAWPHADAAKQARETAVIVGDLFWCLGRAAETDTRLDPAHLPLFLSEKFWAPFARAHDDVRLYAQRAGINVAAVLGLHREHDDLRAHEALLRQFGASMGGGPDGASAGEAPRGPFKALRHFDSAVGSPAATGGGGAGDGAFPVGIRKTPAPVASGDFKRNPAMRKLPPPVRQFSMSRRNTELPRRSVDMVMGRGTPQAWL